MDKTNYEVRSVTFRKGSDTPDPFFWFVHAYSAKQAVLLAKKRRPGYTFRDVRVSVANEKPRPPKKQQKQEVVVLCGQYSMI